MDDVKNTVAENDFENSAVENKTKIKLKVIFHYTVQTARKRLSKRTLAEPYSELT